ncbi:MAG: hypothetical protein KDC12_11275 [Flavobacteriales bacterium]|nr:hypothetical protein [Flavobacteriales bacterium]
MKNLAYLTLIAITLVACTPPLYYPSMVQAPTVHEKGDLEIATYMSPQFGQLQVAFAPHRSVVVGGEFGSDLNTNATDSDERRFYGLNAGYILLPEGVETRLRPTAHVLIGFGSGSTRTAGYFRNDLVSTASYSMIGFYNRLQLTIGGGITHRNVDLLFNSRLSRVSFYSLDVYGNTALGDHENAFVEPTMTIRAGGKHLKFVAQAGLSIPLSDADFQSSPLIIGIGIQTDLNLERFMK